MYYGFKLSLATISGFHFNFKLGLKSVCVDTLIFHNNQVLNRVLVQLVLKLMSFERLSDSVSIL